MLQIAAAEGSQNVSAAQTVLHSDSTETVSVIVKVAGDAVMAQPEAAGAGTGYLDTEQAAQQAEQCAALQQSVQDSIRQFYPDLQVGFSYNTLFNGFSCKLPENLIERVAALPDVLGVTLSENISLPQMNRAAALSGFPAYFDRTGCSGEGQVIAVIDSELDTTHPMFAALADDIDTAVSKDDIADVIDSGTLHVNADPDRAYLSSKLPFVMNYADPDAPYDGISDQMRYHGTHVSGIAAGNAITDYDGTEICGIAKDAQLMFFGVSSGGYAISGDAGLAALEDAVRLHADVINMSWGADKREYWGANPMSEAIAAADRAGVVVCNSAGNADNGVYSWGKQAIPDNPDTGMICDKAELGSPVMLVASADNTGMTESGMFLFEGEQIVLMPMMDTFGTLSYLSDRLEPGEYAYADCGEGKASDFADVQELSGMIALVQRTDRPASEIAQRAADLGACGLILIDKENPDGLEYINTNSDFVIGAISYQDGQAMREAEKKVLTVTGEKVMHELPKSVSSYTSWGVKYSLDLRPDIMGIGGRVRSAAYGNGTQIMSGTSMASPYVAGCTAVLREYLEKQNLGLTGAEYAAYVRRLLMNTAEPYEEDGVFVTPRRQGAGLVALDKAISAKVLMSGESGDAKINLFDKIGDSFRFDLTLTNYSSEDVTFGQADVRLTTDGTYYDTTEECDMLSGQQKLNCTTDLSGPVTVAAGETKQVTVRVSLDAKQCRQLEKTFHYGFFTEGYVMLSGAENSADISIPMLGFHGDWAQIPIVDPEQDCCLIQLGGNQEAFPVSLIRRGQLYKQILEHVPLSVVNDPRMTEGLKEFIFADEYATPAEKKQLNCYPNECWISPNNDSIADSVTCYNYWGYRRDQADYEIVLTDADGNELFRGQGALNGLIDFRKLKEADYDCTISRWIDYPGSKEHPQITTTKIHIDKTAPKVQYETVTENGRTYLNIQASDERQLQGIAVIGIGAGGEAGVYQPGGEKQLVEQINFAAILCMSANNSLGTAGSGYENADKLPYVLRSLANYTLREEGANFNFADVLSPEPDADGVWNVKYDVTDLKNYSFTVMDEAYNYVEIRSTDNTAEDFVGKTGYWVDLKNGLYQFIGDHQIRYTDYWDGSVTDYSYIAEGDRLVLISGEKKKEYSVWYLSDYCYQLRDPESGSVRDVYDESILYPKLSETKLVPANDVLKAAAAEGAAYWGAEAQLSEVNLYNGELDIIMEYDTGSGHKIQERLYVNLRTGVANTACFDYLDGEIVNTDNRTVELCQQYLAKIPAGLYSLPGFASALLFHDDGKTGMILYNGYGEILAYKDTPFTYTLSENGDFTISYSDKTLHGRVMRALETTDDIRIRFEHQDDMRFSSWVLSKYADDPELLKNLRSSDEIVALVTAYIDASAGESSTQDTGRPELYDTLRYGRRIGDNYYRYLLEIDPLTLDFTDGEGNHGNLLHPPVMPANAAYTLPELGQRALEAFGKDDPMVHKVIPFLLSDGRAMVIIQDDLQNTIGKYFADPVTGSVTLVHRLKRGDVNCDSFVDVSDAVLLARLLVEDPDAKILDAGLLGADCNEDCYVTTDDLTFLLQVIARIITF
ncbi:MAG: S8 family serine peptidase [Oscillospiraceae bacterium]|nr:S8 family serine peptidase [Oscillospiraceae bacterium]